MIEARPDLSRFNQNVVRTVRAKDVSILKQKMNQFFAVNNDLNLNKYFRNTMNSLVMSLHGSI